MLAAFGHHDAVAKVGRMKLTGFPAWFLWRSVYLMKMPGLARGARIALDWTADLLFGRDYVQLGVHRDDGQDEPQEHQMSDKNPAPQAPRPAEVTR
jgi:NADH dehydrogenase